MVSHKNVSKSIFSVPVPWILWLWSRTREQKYGDVSLVPRIMNTSALLCVSETITWTYASQPAGNENPCGNGQFWWFLLTTCCRQTGNPSKAEQSSLQQTCWGKVGWTASCPPAIGAPGLNVDFTYSSRVNCGSVLASRCTFLFSVCFSLKWCAFDSAKAASTDNC